MSNINNVTILIIIRRYANKSISMLSLGRGEGAFWPGWTRKVVWPSLCFVFFIKSSFDILSLIKKFICSWNFVFFNKSVTFGFNTGVIDSGVGIGSYDSVGYSPCCGD